MDVLIPDGKLKRALEDAKERQRRYGQVMSKKIRLRMDALTAAETLGDFWPPYSPPERCHELKGNMAGTFSMDLEHPKRLLFKPVSGDEVSEVNKAADITDEKQRWTTIRTIEISEVRDTHD